MFVFIFFILNELFGGSTVYAQTQFQGHGFSVSIAPVVSYQLIRSDAPTAHTKGMLMYGALATIGHKRISGELEYQMGNDIEAFPTQALTMREQREQMKLGLRSAYGVSPVLDVSARLGGQATRSKRQEISLSGTINSDIPLRIEPYIGVGAALNLAKRLSVGLELTFVVPDMDKPSEIEVQSALAVKVLVF